MKKLVRHYQSALINRIVVILLSSFAAGASAEEYIQLPGHVTGLGSNGGIETSADDFQFAEDTLISSLTWWGGYSTASPGPDNFAVDISLNAGFQPGASLRYTEFGLVSAVETGQFFGTLGSYAEMQYSVTFSTPFLAQAGVKYWISIINFEPSRGWLWEASDSSLNPGYARNIIRSGWRNEAGNAAFQLAPVPEPTTWALMGLGLGAIALARTRRSKAK